MGGSLTSRKEAKDGAMGFDFGGIYTEVVENQKIAYTIGDGREVTVTFSQIAPGLVRVVETFEAKSQNPVNL